MSQSRDQAMGAAHAAVSSTGASGHLHQHHHPHPHTGPAARTPDQDRAGERARAYLARMPVSVQGQGGHTAAFRAATTLVNGFALSEHDALPLLLEWNVQCLPPWSEKELRHKLRSAVKNPRMRERGHLLEKACSSSSAPTRSRSARVPRAAFGVPPNAVCSAQQHPGPHAQDRPAQASPGSAAPDTSAQESHAQAPSACAPQETVFRETRKTACGTQALRPSPDAPPSSLPTPTSHLALPLDTAKAKARQRAAWPALEPLTHEDIHAIATLRGLMPDAVDLAHRHGFLKTAVVDGHRSFVIREGTFAQARRLDGQPFTLACGTRIKAKNLPGSVAAFLGRRWLGTARKVLLVEGCIGLLEALAALLRVNTQENWTLLAATSGSTRFARDPELLETLQHRHVRLIPDMDPTGTNAVMSWLGDLRQAGISCDAFPLPSGCKDLGDLLALPAGERRDQSLAELFRAP